MGGKHSSQKGEMKDVLAFFEKELSKWNDNIKNLKESWKEGGDRSWVPVYLRQQMEETEIKWMNIKTMIPLSEQDGGPIKYRCPESELETCCQKAVRVKEEDFNQLRKNNDILLANQQKNERKMNEQNKLIEKLQKANDQLPRNDKEFQEKPIEKEHRESVQLDDHDLKQNVPHLEDEQSSTKAVTGDALTRQKCELEDKLETKMMENEKMSTQINNQEERIRRLEKEKEDLLARNKEASEKITKYEMEGSKQHNKEALQKSKEGKQSPKDHTVQELQKQTKEMKERFQVEKLKMIEECQVLTALNETLETQVGELDKEKKALLLRLSKVAGDKLTKNNSAITDLSDPNRPTKLGEVYSEIYDNEWTDAYEALQVAGYEDETAIETLRLTLQHVMQFCESNADLLIKKSSNAVNLLFEEYQKPASDMKKTPQLTMPPGQAREVGMLLRQKSSIEDIKFQQRWKPIKVSDDKTRKMKEKPGKAQKEEKSNLDVDSKLKQMRREMATYMVPIVQKVYMDTNWSNEYIDDLKPFILKCVFIAWMMIVQSPPMSLHKYPCEKETKFDKTLYKEYTASGPLVRYVVWPALLLKEDGPVVCKGVAEGKAGLKRSTSQNS